MSKKPFRFLFLIFFLVAGQAFSSNYLFFLEAQGVAGYSSGLSRAIFFSMSRMEVMQKPSLGFDYVQRFAKETGDFAVLAVQARLALNLNSEGEKTVEPQLYNAYLKLKFQPADLWLGHNRPKLGLASVLDSHSLLLQPLSMNGFGFDRDWGVGAERDFARGNAGVSLTTGSGMPLHFKGNYLLAGRISRGILQQENYSLGLSVAFGKTLDTMGYHLMAEEPMLFRMAGADWTYLWNNLESRLEVVAGKKSGHAAYAFFWRGGVNLLEEGRLKMEVQPTVWRTGGETQFQFSSGVSYLASGDWTLRAMYQYDKHMKDSRVVFQVYYYKGLRF